ncbi:MAG: 2-oxoglutarate dehydrogenase complex dihydrolipoyllysine-residue succinyltransferase [Rhodospirillales bacterium]|jgi:2-oxoglutarate dehydrogenase E2 component (dihydrolipoamide succinyltransferase)|nr:2-oxoglutarate dehydrogenase complex dihydrolipoyllysine-residue succinyltransferase [Rhodospirillales bacterium]
MATDIIVPTLGESVTEATVAKWFKAVGDPVAADEPLVELETDKVTVEVNAPASGTLEAIAADEGAEVEVGGVLGAIGEGDGAGAAKPKAKAEAPIKQAEPKAERTPPQPAAAPPPSAPPAAAGTPAQALAPAVRKLIEENGLDPAQIPASGKDGRLTKGDVLAFVETRAKAGPAVPAARAPEAPKAPAAPRPAGANEERVKMTRLRRMIAQRLKDAQNTAAMLTTFNEVDMTAANALRGQYRDAFEKKHGARLGVMSIFVKACIVALREFPAVNAEIDGEDIVYKNHYDVAIAVSSPNGLVVPVVRDADTLSMAEIEKTIADFGKRARDGKLAIEEMQGGTFTITNGGVFGSLMSTPILNPPQSGILGMHKIQQRPMVMPNGSIEARPMMYLALSYDHRIVDGREAVSFLVRVKECVEDPQRILLDA